MSSILDNLTRHQKAYQRRPSLATEADLVAEYDAIRRAYVAAMACNNIESALLWSDRANDIAREMARMQDYMIGTEDETPAYEQRSA